MVTNNEKANEERLLTVSWGKEVMQPLQFHSIEIGPFQMAKKVRREETAEAASEMYEEMEKMAEEMFEKKELGSLQTMELPKAMILWGMLNLYIWHKIFIDNIDAAEIAREALERHRFRKKKSA